MPFDPKDSRNAFIQAYHLLENKLNRSTLIHTICGVVETILTEWGDFRQLDPWIEELGSLLKDEKNLQSEDIPEGLNCITVAQMCFEKGDEKMAKELNARAETIAHSMQSRYLEMLSLFNQAYFNLKCGKHDQAEKPLTAALKIQKDLDLKNFSTWRQEFMQDLYEKVLRSGINHHTPSSAQAHWR